MTVIEIKCTVNVMCSNHPKTTPGSWKNHLPRNQSLVPERLRTVALEQPDPLVDPGHKAERTRESGVAEHLCSGERWPSGEPWAAQRGTGSGLESSFEA